MTTDELEFLISQHFDGTLTEEESNRLRALIESNAAVKAMFDDYAAVDSALRATQSKLVVDEDWLGAQIADRIDEANTTPIRVRNWGWAAPMAMAACLLIGLTLGVIFLTEDDKPIVAIANPAAPSAVTQIALSGSPVENAVRGGGVATISIGTPTNLTPHVVTALYFGSQDLMESRVSIAAAGRRATDMFD